MRRVLEQAKNRHKGGAFPCVAVILVIACVEGSHVPRGLWRREGTRRFRFLNMREETPREPLRDDLTVPFDHLDHHEVGGPRGMQVQGSYFIARADVSDPHAE
jgi:hypothetical protein